MASLATSKRHALRDTSFRRNVVLHAKMPTAQIAHLVFADTQSSTKNPIELLLANSRKGNEKFQISSKLSM
jgi:hypothetical protein